MTRFDDSRIADVVEAFGGNCVMTRSDHPSGTDRIAEIARRCCPDAEILVNVQGDEPEIDPAQIDTLVELGAGKVLTGLARRIDRDMTAISIEGPDDIEVLVKML